MAKYTIEMGTYRIGAVERVDENWPAERWVAISAADLRDYNKKPPFKRQSFRTMRQAKAWLEETWHATPQEHRLDSLKAMPVNGLGVGAPPPRPYGGRA